MNELQKLVRYKAWADDLLFEAIAAMPDAALVAPQPIVFGNLARTLNHVLAMDFVWRSHLLGQPHGLTSRNPDHCPAFREIVAAQKAMDRWFVDYADALTPARSGKTVEFTFIGGGAGLMTRADILLHVVNHATYHRGHIAQMMRASQPPPITDYPVFVQTLARNVLRSDAATMRGEAYNTLVSASINADLSVRVAVDTAAMDWSPSPSGSVWRKRVHLVGPPEAGQVTSVVRYDPDSAFHAHDHPAGEEILVLEGVFSDEHGDWPAGTFLLNPEGFRHAPFSKPGCTLFVKLRQFAGPDRQHVVIDTNALQWKPPSGDCIERKLLYRQDGYRDEVCLERWPAGTDLGAVAYPAGAELFVLDGGFEDETGTFGKGCWLRLPAGARHRPRAEHGCTLYIKTGGLTYLNSAAE